ncbi:MAG TPA: LptA/OstA family protein [Caulobacteraceae bacterium]|jgi:lipopolysaccharide export system protein LptA
MNRTWIIGLAGVIALAAAGVAQAQLSSKGGAIDVSADHFTSDNNANSATWEGHVEALQDDNRMRSDNLVIFFQPRSAAPAEKKVGADDATPMTSKVDHMVATGNVYFVTPTQVIRGDKAVYTKADDTIVVTGQVVATQGQNVMRGTRLVYHHSTGQSTMDSDTGRVRSVIYQDKKAGA